MKKITLAIAAVLVTPSFFAYAGSHGKDGNSSSRSESSSRSSSSSKAVSGSVSGAAAGVENNITVNPGATRSAPVTVGATTLRGGSPSASTGDVNVAVTDGRNYSDIPWYGWMGTSSSPNPGNNTSVGQNTWSVALPLVGGGYSGTENDELTRAMAAIQLAHKHGRRDIVDLGFRSIGNELRDDIDHNSKSSSKSTSRANSNSSSSANSNAVYRSSLEEFGS